jgi:hypothetical protein
MGNPYIVTGLVAMCDYLSASLPAGPKVMYELGSYAGEAAEIFVRFFDVVHCVDPWNASYEFPVAPAIRSFDQLSSRFPNSIIKHVARLEEAVKTIPPESLDFVYCDALHTYEATLSAIQLWWPTVRPGAFMGGHDYNSDQQGVVRAVNTFLSNVPQCASTLKLWPDWSFTIQKRSPIGL